MENKRAVMVITIGSIIIDVINSAITGNTEYIQTKRAFENKDLKDVFVMVGAFPNLVGQDEIINHYQVSVISNPTRYPIDILEIIHKASGMWLRFSGIEIPMILEPNIVITKESAIKAILDLLIDTNPMLLDLLGENNGGKNGTKKPRK